MGHHGKIDASWRWPWLSALVLVGVCNCSALYRWEAKMQVVGVVAMSHSPSWDLRPVDGVPKAFVDAAFRARDVVREIKPDVLVVFGPDHARNFFFDMMPAFCIGVEKVNGFGDFETPKGPLRTMPELATFVAQHVEASGFDPALSYNMGVDHGITQPLAVLTPDLSTPVVPIMVSSFGPPLPTLRRCYEFGRSVGEAIRAYEGKGRALIVGSGGLSHWPPSVSPADPTIAPETRDYAINGRPRVAEFNAAREESSKSRRAAGGTGPINEEWDRWLLERLHSGDLEPVLAIDNETLLAETGPGGQEIRSWIAAMGAWGAAAQSIDYAPVPTWITGMGCATAYIKDVA
jgi:2,3-dihydroxyphenylpropionate 1,2-dioxygenase